MEEPSLSQQSVQQTERAGGESPSLSSQMAAMPHLP